MFSSKTLRKIVVLAYLMVMWGVPSIALQDESEVLLDPASNIDNGNVEPQTHVGGIAHPEDFGYNSARVTGRRPLLVILVDYTDTTFRHSLDSARNLIVGSDYPNIVDYYRENSDGVFTWAVVGVVGPYRFRDNPSTRWNESTFACWGLVAGACPDRPSGLDQLFVEMAITLAFNAGFNFHAYDANRDGRLTTEELGILIIGAAPRRRISPGANGRLDSRTSGDDIIIGAEIFPGPDGTLQSTAAADDRVIVGDGAATRDTCDRLSLRARTTLRICLDYSFVQEWASFTSIAHELYHTVNRGRNWDLYGSRGRLNFKMTLMGATIMKVEDDRQTFHLDPWHKIQSGWALPRVLKIPPATSSQCVTLFDTTPSTRTPTPVIVYDPSRVSSATVRRDASNLDTIRNTKEYFIFELRNPVRYDANIPDRGVAVWYVHTTSDNRLMDIPADIQAGANNRLDTRPVGDDVSSGGLIFIGANGRLDTTRMSDDVYGGDHSVWLISSQANTSDGRRGGTQLWKDSNGVFQLQWLDGTNSGLSFLVGPFGSLSVELEFNPGTLRIDSISPTQGPPGSEVILRGHFGVQRGTKIVSINRGKANNMEILSWSCNEIRARVPSDLTPGSYRVLVYHDSTRRTSSNSVPFEVIPIKIKIPLVEGVSLSSQGDAIVLRVDGQGIENVNLQVFSLSGRPLYDQTTKDSLLIFSPVDAGGRRWANGVYLYVVTVRGLDGSVIRREVKKFVILR